MGERTWIKWTDHTFNPWWGCEKVSPACASCYAEEFANRFPKTRGLWGKDAPRKIASEKVWHDPEKWNRQALEAGVRRRVFCASMADVFEDRRDLDEPRARLFDLIERTPGLEWQLLTKRPGNMGVLVPPHWRTSNGGMWPANVWAGATVESQAQADERVPMLLHVPARVHFLSCEPLLGPVDLSAWLFCGGCPGGNCDDGSGPRPEFQGGGDCWAPGIEWVIAGGESGSAPRPMSPLWARALRDQCERAGVPFFFKQWGEYSPNPIGPAGLRVTDAVLPGGQFVRRVGTKAAGAILDGVAHEAFPSGAPLR